MNKPNKNRHGNNQDRGKVVYAVPKAEINPTSMVEDAS